MQNVVAPIILASTSPRRRELITLFGPAFQFVSADVDESPLVNESPADLVSRLSRAKAEIGARNAGNPNAIVIGADTVVALDQSILGKPTDSGDAVRMLTLLRNRSHVVFSGVTVRRAAHVVTKIATTTVHMRDFTDDEIAAFVATGAPLDKAAAYAIQSNTFAPVARIEGCFANVMGLPMCHLYRALRGFDLEPAEPRFAEPDRACQAHLNIVCPVAREILGSS